MAAPVGGQVLKEVLSYLELQNDKEIEEDSKVQEIEVPKLIGLSVKDAKEQLKEYDMELRINSLESNSEADESRLTIKEQLPKPGIIVNNTNKVYVDIN